MAKTSLGPRGSEPYEEGTFAIFFLLTRYGHMMDRKLLVAAGMHDTWLDFKKSKGFGRYDGLIIDLFKCLDGRPLSVLLNDEEDYNLKPESERK